MQEITRMSQVFDEILKYAGYAIEYIGDVWEWAITPISFGNLITSITPIMAMCGSGLLIVLGYNIAKWLVPIS